MLRGRPAFEQSLLWERKGGSSNGPRRCRVEDGIGNSRAGGAGGNDVEMVDFLYVYTVVTSPGSKAPISSGG